MQTIISVFRPWLDSQPNLDYTLTKFGWARLSLVHYDEPLQVLKTPVNLLCALAADFWDRCEDPLEEITPYLRQLPQAQADYARTALEVYSKLGVL